LLRGANGLIAWKTEDGKSLKQLDEQAYPVTPANAEKTRRV
jgi:hypothetical protein